MRRNILWGIVGVIVAGLLVWGGIRQWNAVHNPYAGLTLWRETQMDDATRSLFSQRLATTQAAIVAHKAAGEDIPGDLYESVAYDAYVLGDLVASREGYEAVLNENSLYYVAWNGYAKVLDAMGDYARAEPAYLQAIDMGKAEQYYIDYVDFLQRRFPERDMDVKTTLEQAVVVLGQTQQFMMYLGEWYAAHGDCDRAIAHMHVAATINPAAKESIMQKIADARVACAASTK